MIRNFLFHRVHPERDIIWDPMDVELFDKCIEFISKKYKVVLIEDLVNSPQLISSKSIVTISFDDGYKGNITYAAPILKKHNCKASFYVVTDCIENNVPTWTHLLEHAFQYTTIEKLDLNFDFLAEQLRSPELNTKEKRITFIKRLNPVLRNLSHEERYLVLDRIHSTYNDIEIPRFMMNWDDLRTLKSEGHYIGSHTVTHTMLGAMTEESGIRFELLNSAQKIENELGHFPKSISYPIGSYNESTIKISKEVGYELGLAVEQKPYYPSKNSLFEIPRIELYNESWFKTKLRITNRLEQVKSLIGYR